MRLQTNFQVVPGLSCYCLALEVYRDEVESMNIVHCLLPVFDFKRNKLGTFLCVQGKTF